MSKYIQRVMEVMYNLKKENNGRRGARRHTYKMQFQNILRAMKILYNLKGGGGGWEGAVAWIQELSQVIEREVIMEEKTGGSAEMSHLLNASKYSMQVLC